MNAALQTLMADNGWEDFSDWPRPLAYGLAALLCAALGRSESLALRTPQGVLQLWLRLSPLYLLLAASALFQGDVLWVHWARDFAHAHQVYQDRRLFQLAALLLLAAVGWKQWRLRRSRASMPRTLLLLGVCGTLLVVLLRYVSFHYTDLVIDALWLNHHVGTWLELASLGLAGLGSGLEILRSYGHV